MSELDRIADWKTVNSQLTLSDIQQADNFSFWMAQWGNYIVSGGDRPPVKPIHG